MDKNHMRYGWQTDLKATSWIHVENVSEIYNEFIHFLEDNNRWWNDFFGFIW